jgi:hypothetical protein
VLGPYRPHGPVPPGLGEGAVLLYLGDQADEHRPRARLRHGPDPGSQRGEQVIAERSGIGEGLLGEKFGNECVEHQRAA